MNSRDVTAAGSAASPGTLTNPEGGLKPKSSLFDVLREELLEMTGHDMLVTID